MYNAKVADILRCSQRDELFVKNSEEDIFSILKLYGVKNYGQLRKIVPVIANIWYYYLTSLNNLQTLGEEYTGTLRYTNKNRIPSKLAQLCWLILYVGGESGYDRFLNNLKVKLETSANLTHNAKSKLLSCTSFLRENKVLLLRLHYSLFYIYGKYYNVANRIIGIKYILTRPWLQDDSSTNSFKILGNLSLLYLFYTLIRGISSQKDDPIERSAINSSVGILCSLCTENRKDTCSTPCGHLFCWKCIYESLNYQQCCPICRETINPCRIIHLQNYE